MAVHPSWPTIDPEHQLSTARLVLEPLAEAHAGELFDGLRAPGLYRHLDEPAPGSLAALAARYRQLATRRSPDGAEAWLNWAGRELATGAIAGLVQATVRPSAPALLAYLFVPAGQGRGLAREASARVVRLLLDEYRVAGLEATVERENRRSIALLVALGFVRARREPGSREADGEWRFRLPLPVP